MQSRALRGATGAILIIVPLLFTACFFVLQATFEYPDILRRPPAEVLALFAGGGSTLIGTWYVLLLTAVLFVPLAVLVHRVVERNQSSVLWIATTFGVIAGLVQALGFARWPFLVPSLAAQFLSPEASEAQRAAVAVVFDAFNRYAGVALGEHLGFAATAVWTIMIAPLLGRAGVLPRPMVLAGMLFALCIAAGLLEPAGWEPAGAINAVGYLLWAAWLVIVGVLMLRAPRPSPLSPATGEAARA